MGKIRIYFENISGLRLPRKKIMNWLLEIAEEENFSCGEINFIFCTDDYLLEVNRKFLRHNFLTDIITFDYTENREISGDLFLSLERIKENASTFKNPIKDEVFRVMLHGVLHLLGYKDKSKDEKKVMREKEDFYLEKFKTLK
jgi:probable rRNA maturation factor